MTNDSTAVDFGINLLEEEVDDVIFRTNEFLTDATFTLSLIHISEPTRPY